MLQSSSSSSSAVLLLRRTVLLIYLLVLSLTVVEAGEHEALDYIARTFPDWKPNAILDVGANKGTWTRFVCSMFTESKFLMVEASENLGQHLAGVVTELVQQYADKPPRNNTNTTKWLERTIAVTSEKDGQEVDWYEIEDVVGATGNTMFAEVGGHDQIEPKKRKTKTIDTIRKESFLKDERVDYLKLDVQGAELVVLGGAKELLKEVAFVQFESSFTVYNKGQPCFYEIDDFLRRHGFYIYDFGDINRNIGTFKTGGIGQVDMIYANPKALNFPQQMKDLGDNPFCGADKQGGPFLNYQGKNVVEVMETVHVPIMDVQRAEQERNLFVALFLGFLAGYMFANYRSKRREKLFIK